MRIAVTGGSGFIGSALVQRVLQVGNEVIIVDIRAPRKSITEARIADVLDLAQLRSALEGMDVVYHLAGPVLADMKKDPYRGCQLQFNGTLNVLEACRVNGIKKILLASSFYVYSGVDERAVVNEESLLDILKMDLFGASKIMSEVLVRYYSSRYGLKYVIFRIGPVYGAGECTSVVGTFIDAGLAGQPILIWGDGRRRSQHTYIEDVAEAGILALQKTNQVYNVISPEVITTRQLVELLKARFGFDVVYDATRKQGLSMPYISPAKAITQLGWCPVRIDKGLDRMVTEMVLRKDRGL